VPDVSSEDVIMLCVSVISLCVSIIFVTFSSSLRL
jgi:hypothetical protein